MKPAHATGWAAPQQADALVADIAAEAAAERRALLDTAAEQAEAVRERARVKARRQLRRAIADMRASARQRQQSQTAQLETARRQQATERSVALLTTAWPLLGEALARRWREPALRATWQRAQLALAAARWPQARGLLRHPGDTSAEERSHLRGLLDTLGLDGLSLQADPTLSVGLVLESDGARLDSTPRALLADRSRVEATVLAAVEPTSDD